MSRQPDVKPGDVVGYFVGYFIAMDPITGEKKWQQPLADMASSSGMLVTGGGLVFTRKLTGEIVALDEDTGKTLWQFKTGSSVNATAILRWPTLALSQTILSFGPMMLSLV